MNVPADVEVKFEFNNQRKYPAVSGYRPHHLVKDDYLTTGVHQQQLDFDFFYEYILLKNKFGEMSFCFNDDIERFLGIMKEENDSYWVGLCDIEGGMSFDTADKMINAKVYAAKSLKERWDEVYIISIDALSLEEWLENCF